MRILKIVLTVLAIFILIGSSVAYFSIKKINSFNIKQENNKTSILILGKGGEGHTAPDLTDTIMLANLNLIGNKINIISLPRDIWVESTKAKLNSSYYWGKEKGGNGFDLAAETVNEVTGVKPQYVVVVDFTLFKDVVDNIGGIDVNVDNSFTDEKYPISGKENDLCNGDKLYKCRYETLTFVAGKQHMDGELALKFVRSRNSASDEGTDTARSKRQQKVISAIKEKLISKDFIFNPTAIKLLFGTMISHVETNIDMESVYSIGRELFKSRNNINSISIPDEMLKVSQNDKKYDKQYVFVPASGSWKKLQEWISNNM